MKSVRKNASHQGAEARIPDPAGRGPEVARGHLVQVSRPVQLEGELRRCRLPLQEQVRVPGAFFVYRVWSRSYNATLKFGQSEKLRSHS